MRCEIPPRARDAVPRSTPLHRSLFSHYICSRVSCSRPYVRELKVSGFAVSVCIFQNLTLQSVQTSETSKSVDVSLSRLRLPARTPAARISHDVSRVLHAGAQRSGDGPRCRSESPRRRRPRDLDPNACASIREPRGRLVLGLQTGALTRALSSRRASRRGAVDRRARQFFVLGVPRVAFPGA
jgi:hypothetical protein